MASFYEKLSMKLQAEGSASSAVAKDPPTPRAVSYNVANGKVAPKPEAAGDPPPAEPQPDGTEPLGVDLFQSETRMVVFVQASGVALEDFDITADEESNTLLLQAIQKRPDVPLAKGASELEKGRYVKQEAKWNALYRKVYLPEPFDSGEAEALITNGVLIVILPIRKPGEGKKLSVRALKSEEPKK